MGYVTSIGCNFIIFGSIHAKEVSKCALLNSTPKNLIYDMIDSVQIITSARGGGATFCAVFILKPHTPVCMRKLNLANMSHDLIDHEQIIHHDRTKNFDIQIKRIRKYSSLSKQD